MAYYDDPCKYLEDCSTIQAKIARYDSLINALYDAADKAVLKQHMDEYWLDDGQTKVKAIYRSIDSIAQAIQDFERLRQMNINRLNGRVITLKDRHSNIC